MEKFKWFFAGQDEKEEAWLREMALSGQHLESLRVPGFYRFSSGKPRNDFFRLDFIKTPMNDLTAYHKTINTAGWEYVGQMNSWQYLRRSAKKNEIPELHGNDEAKAEKYQRLMVFLVGSIPFLLIFPPMIGKGIEQPYYEILRVIYFLFLLFDGFSTMNVYKRIMQLRES